jgi:hypothetical protein
LLEDIGRRPKEVIVDLGCRGVAPTIVKLFLSKHYKYGCHSETGGKQGLGSL